MEREFLPTFRAGQQQLSARDMNKMVDLILGMEDRISKLEADRGGIENSEFWIKNLTGTTLQPFYIVGLGDSLYDPSASYDDEKQQWRQVVVINGETPDSDTHRNKIAVVQEGGVANSILRATKSGLVQCQINVTDEGHEWADVKDGDVTQLQSRFEGMARIIWKEAGVGTKWGLVWINAHHMGQKENPLTDLTDGWDQEDYPEPKEGVKMRILTVAEDYTPASGQTMRNAQFDSFGHLVILDNNPTESSSSDAISSSSSSPLKSSSSSTDGDVDFCGWSSVTVTISGIPACVIANGAQNGTYDLTREDTADYYGDQGCWYNIDNGTTIVRLYYHNAGGSVNWGAYCGNKTHPAKSFTLQVAASGAASSGTPTNNSLGGYAKNYTGSLTNYQCCDVASGQCAGNNCSTAGFSTTIVSWNA